MGFSRQEYWSGLPRLPEGNLPDPGIDPRSPALQADSLLSEPPGKPLYIYVMIKIINRKVGRIFTKFLLKYVCFVSVCATQ